MTPDALLFALVAAITVASALTVVTHPHPVYSALALVVTLFQIAILFLLLGAQAVAFLQVLVYAGAIMVLFLFVIMLLNLERDPEGPTPGWRRASTVLGAILAVELGGLLLFIQPHAPSLATDPEFGSFASLGRRLFTDYALSFELTSVLLLVAIVGAVVLARKPERGRAS